MAYRSSLPFGMRWSNVKDWRRDSIAEWVHDLVYLVSGFHL